MFELLLQYYFTIRKGRSYKTSLAVNIKNGSDWQARLLPAVPTSYTDSSRCEKAHVAEAGADPPSPPPEGGGCFRGLSCSSFVCACVCVCMCNKN